MQHRNQGNPFGLLSKGRHGPVVSVGRPLGVPAVLLFPPAVHNCLIAIESETLVFQHSLCASELKRLLEINLSWLPVIVFPFLSRSLSLSYSPNKHNKGGKWNDYPPCDNLKQFPLAIAHLNNAFKIKRRIWASVGRAEVSTDVPQTAKLFDANSGCMCCHVVISIDRAVSPALPVPWRCSSAGPVQSTSCLSGSDALVGVSERISPYPVFTFILRRPEDAVFVKRCDVTISCSRRTEICTHYTLGKMAILVSQLARID